MKHKPKKFFIEGIVADDADLITAKKHWLDWLYKEMRGEGFVPMLGQDPFWSTLRLRDTTYKAQLSIYAVYVGKEDSWTIEGMDATGKMLPRIPPNRLSTS